MKEKKDDISIIDQMPADGTTNARNHAINISVSSSPAL